MTHDDLRNLIPGHALGALDAGDRHAVEAHLAVCRECAAALEELHRTATAIGLDAEPVTPPLALRRKVLARIEQERIAQRGAAPARMGTAHRWLAAASVVAATAAVVYAWALRAEVEGLRRNVAAAASHAADLRAELATARRSQAALMRTMEVLRSPDVQRVDLKSTAEPSAAVGRAYWSRTGVFFSAERLPALPENRVYQLWLIAGSTPIDAGTFVPDPSGMVVITTAALTASPPDAFGVTVEPPGGSPTPTLPIVMIGSAR